MVAVPQHMRALALANDKRGDIRAFKQRIRNVPPPQGAYLIADALISDPMEMGSARLRPLLLCIRSFGEKKVTTCLVAAKVLNFDARLRDLSVSQRQVVALQLELWADLR